MKVCCRTGALVVLLALGFWPGGLAGSRALGQETGTEAEESAAAEAAEAQAEALAEEAAVHEPPPDAERIGTDTCLGCHEAFEEGWETARHQHYMRMASLPESLQGCEGCHGAGSAHLEDPEFKHIRQPEHMNGLPAVQMCLACHETEISPTLWMASGHGQADLQCGSCHEVHDEPAGPYLLTQTTITAQCLSCHPDQEAEFRLNSHHPVLEERMECTDCHDPHAPAEHSQELLKSGDDKCLSCHMDKQGPFVFEHQTALDGNDEKCSTCHRPHGSPNRDLLTFFSRGTCLQCHSDIAADPAHQNRGGDCWRSGCHFTIHGSNRNRLFLQ